MGGISRMYKHRYEDVPEDDEPGNDVDKEKSENTKHPAVNTIVHSVITSIKPHLGLFLELPLPDGDTEGLVHLTEISRGITQLVKRSRGKASDKELLSKELHKQFAPGDKLYVKILKYKLDRGKIVADVTMLNVNQDDPTKPLRDYVSPPPERKQRLGKDYVEDDRGGRKRKVEESTQPQKSVRSEHKGSRRKHGLQGLVTGRTDRVILPELHTVHRVKIINAFHDGIFVTLPGYEVDGLVHHSQISRRLDMDNTVLPKVERFRRIQEIVGGMHHEVWVKVVYVARTEHLKCECSLKMVSQKDGRDLDPDFSMWLDYMRLRRSKGAGYMHPEMKAEMEHIERLVGRRSYIDPPSPEDQHLPPPPRHIRPPLESFRNGGPLYHSHSPTRRRCDDYESPRYKDDVPYQYPPAAASLSPREPIDPPLERKDVRSRHYQDQYDDSRSIHASSIRAGPWDKAIDHRVPESRDDSLSRRLMSSRRAPDKYPSEVYSHTAPDHRSQVSSWEHRDSPRIPSTSAHAVSASDLLSDPVINAKFEDLVAAQVRAQLSALQAGGLSSLGGHHSSSERSRRSLGHRDR